MGPSHRTDPLHRPDVAIIDLHMSGMEAGEAISAILKGLPAVRIIIFSAFNLDEEVYQVLRAGARGYMLKDTPREDLLRCIRAVVMGEMWIHPLAAARLAERTRLRALTAREREVLGLVVAGKSNKEIGSSLDLTEGTVKVHVNHIFSKLGAAGRVAAVGIAVQRGLVSLFTRQLVAPRDLAHKDRGPAA